MEKESNVNALRKKFLSVLSSVLSSGNEENIVTTLSSLFNICESHNGLLIPSESDDDNSEEIAETSEFICSFIAELLAVETSQKVLVASINLQINILQFLATRNNDFFPRFLKEYIKIGQDGMDVLMEESPPKTHKCFSGILDPKRPNYKSIEILLKDDKFLHNLLITLSEVLGKLGSYLMFYLHGFLDEVWLFLGRGLQYGSCRLKASSMASICCLFSVCGLPSSIQTQDYIIQLIGSCTLYLAKAELSCDTEGETKAWKMEREKLGGNLRDLVSTLRVQLDSLYPIVLQEVYVNLRNFMKYTELFVQLRGDLLRELLLLVCDVVGIESKKPFNNEAFDLLNEATSKAMRCPQVTEVCAKFLVLKDLDEVIPKSDDSTKPAPRKRTFHQSECESVAIEAWNVSPWWAKIVDDIKSLIEEIRKDNSPERNFSNNFNIIFNYLKLCSEIIAHYSSVLSVNILYLPVDVLQYFSDLSLSILSMKHTKENILVILSVLEFMTFICVSSKVPVDDTSMPFFQTSVAISSLSWLASEMNWLDLKGPSKSALSSLVSIVSKSKFLNDHEIRSRSIPILALSPRNVAPSWRCFVLRAILNEDDESILANMAQWLPVFVNQISNSSGRAILEASVTKLIMSDNKDVLSKFTLGLRRLFCAAANQTRIKPKKEFCCSFNCLYCHICDHEVEKWDSTTSGSRSQGFHTQISSTLIQSVMNLLETEDNDILALFLDCLPSLEAHAILPLNSFSLALRLILHGDENIKEKTAETLGKILNYERRKLQQLQEEERNADKGTLILTQLADFLLNEDTRKSYFENHKYILQLLYNFTSSDYKHVEKDILNLVVPYIISPNRVVLAFGAIFISDWCNESKISHKELYSRNVKSVAEVVASYIKTDGGLVLSQLSDTFCWSQGKDQSWESFGKQQLQHILPPLVLRAAKEGSPNILIELSNFLNLRLRDTIIDHFQYIFPHLVFNGSLEEKKKVLSFISSITNISIANIRKCSLQDQVNELIYGFNRHREAVLSEFLEMTLIENGSSDIKKLGAELDASEKLRLVGEFLAPRLLGIFGFLDGKLMSQQSSLKDKEEILLSLSDLLGVMKKEQVSPVARKVLASLKGALSFKNKNLRRITCKTWTSFLNSLDENALESIIEEVVVLCLPLLKENPEELAPMFKKILLETPCVRPLLEYMPLFPPHSSLSTINEAIRRAQEHLNRSSNSSVIENLEVVKRSLGHESQDLRLHSLKKLKSILTKNQDVIHDLILNFEKSHEIVSVIFTALLGQCRGNEKLNLLVAECLGLFGAIDPTRLTTDSNQKDKLDEIYSSIETEPFVHRLVMELSRAFLSTTNTSTQTCALYAMQEILKTYKIGPSASRSANTLGSSVYSKLPSNVQEMLKPLQSSKYMVNSATQKMPSTLPCPLYRTMYSKMFNKWVTTWTFFIVDLLVEDVSKQVFSVCKPIIRRDSSTALCLLPPLIICALTESHDNCVPISTEILAVLELREQSQVDAKTEPSEQLQHLAVQTIFSCLDYVCRWSQERRQQETTYRKNKVVFSPSVQLQNVMDFLDQIPSLVLAQTSFRCQAYSRALLHLESYLTKHPDHLKANLSFLQSIYVALDDPDGVAGVAAVRQEEPTLEEQIIEYESTGRLHDALGCYERLCIANETQDAYEGMVKCYLALGQPQSVLNITQGLSYRNSEIGSTLHEYRVEAAWLLGQWDQLQTLVEAGSDSPLQSSWGVGVGKALLSAREKNSEAYWKVMHQLRVQQTTPLSAASMEKGAYQRSYPYILRLQILKELDEVVSGLMKIPGFRLEDSVSLGSPVEGIPSLTLDDLVRRWNRQFTLVQTSRRFLEPLLNFRRTLLSFAEECAKESNPELSQNLAEELQKIWLQSAKVARKAGHLQQGELAFYGAGHGRSVFMERAKWHWAKGEHPQAVTVLKRGIEKFFPNVELLKQNQTEDNLPDRQICAEAKLLLAHYSEESATQDVSAIKMYYRDVCEINRSSEDGHFNLAMYYDRILNSLEMKEKPVDWLSHIVQSFGKSLNFGCRHLYQSMPRLLSIWLDHGAKVAEGERLKSNTQHMTSYREKLSLMNSFLLTCLERLPSYMFLIALPQLISRICHSHNEVFSVLGKVIAKLLSIYPQQAMWHMIAVSKSSYQIRHDRCIEIFESAKKLRPTLDKFIYDSKRLADMFVDLAEKHVEKGTLNLSLRNTLRNLPSLLSDQTFSNIIIPLQQQMNITLPASYSKDGVINIQSLNEHNPFSGNEVYLAGIEDVVDIMQSLVQPKKITLRGSDGHKYSMMCKPKDDMRKDCRLMEFNSYVNRLLKHDPESRKRDLKIRTYMVVPLNEECGLLEWVPNLSGMRHILHRLYKEQGLYTSANELKSLMCRVGDPLAKKKEVYVTKLLPKHPPIFHHWFLLNFVDPQAWLQARWLYCRTTAVMSMVGYIVGLGDRHGENILFDAESGDTVHVDFNCLFNKGETFDWPERVPFRLTHNMVSAMGPTGYEGIFRKTCEVTMRVMRKERDELMSVLKPFIYDPLVEWEKADRKAAKTERVQKVKGTGEICNAKAQQLVKCIEERLNGQIRSNTKGVHFPLSVEGQVNVLIEESTSVDNLCQMFIGWAPFM